MLATIQSSCRGLLAAAILLACVGVTQAADTGTVKVTELPPVTGDATSSEAAETKAAAPVAPDALPADKTAKRDPPAKRTRRSILRSNQKSRSSSSSRRTWPRAATASGHS